MEKFLKSLKAKWVEIVSILPGVAGVGLIALGADAAWMVAWFIAPIVVLEWRWPWLRANKQADLGKTFGRALLGGWGVFLVLALAPWFSAPKPIVGIDNPARNWLGIDSLAKRPEKTKECSWFPRALLTGDWRYAFAPAEPASQNLVVLLANVPAAETRRHMASLVAAAKSAGATGIAFDYSLPKPSPIPGFDAQLCTEIVKARGEKGSDGGEFSVFVGCGVDPDSDTYVIPKVPAETLRAPSFHPPGTGCLRDEDVGHLMVHEGADGLGRYILSGLAGGFPMPPLSVRVADAIRAFGGLATSEAASRATLMQILPPSSDKGEALVVKRYPADIGDASLLTLLRGRFVLVGEEFGDEQPMPFSRERLPGVYMHAYAVEALLTGSTVIRSPWWLAVLAALFPMASLAGRAAHPRTTRRSLVISAAAAVGASIALSAAAMAWGRIWLDVVYVVVATGVFLAVVVALPRPPTPKAEHAGKPGSH